MKRAVFPIRKENEVLRKSTCRGMSIVFLVNLLAGSLSVQAQDKLPQTSDYLGEIRRGVDGKLMVLPEAELTTQRHSGVSESKATMVVGPGEMVSTVTEAARLARDGEVIEIR
ncbi:MAG: hypothetical protein WCB88_05340, partial [Azonexus sp.]